MGWPYSGGRFGKVKKMVKNYVKKGKWYQCLVCGAVGNWFGFIKAGMCHVEGIKTFCKVCKKPAHQPLGECLDKFLDNPGAYKTPEAVQYSGKDTVC